ncbi:TolC family outer membrane protein [Aquimonas sp.]|jgi:outer membrane protein|uniref:TolC family outer membrane protein n=1 Tax=Aquimonas sp. TaxID=1872588 RepID=UPI0037C08EB1
MRLPVLRPLCFAFALAAVGSANAADLMQAYELARQSDPQLAAVEMQRLATGEGVNQNRSALLPQLSGSAGFTDSTTKDSRFGPVRNADNSFAFGNTTTYGENRGRSWRLDLQQSLYDHRNYTRLRASRARADAADADLDAAIDGLALRVAQAYFTALTTVDSLIFARADERAVKRQLDQAEQRFEVGLTAITDVHEARARYDGSRANAINAENALDDAREALAELTGQQLANLQGLDESFAPGMPEPAQLEAWVQTALAENPLLRSRALALDAAQQDIMTARSGHLPTLGLSASRNGGAGWGESLSSTGLASPGTTDDLGSSISLNLNVPLYSGGLTQSQVRQSVYNRDATEDRLEQERRAVTRQTRNAYRAVVAGISEIEARRQALVSARSALEATEAGFEVGTRTIVDVLLSQQVLTSAQRDYSNARHSFLVNGLSLKQSAGVIDIKDIAGVNRLLVRDAEAALAEFERERD